MHLRIVDINAKFPGKTKFIAGYVKVANINLSCNLCRNGLWHQPIRLFQWSHAVIETRQVASNIAWCNIGKASGIAMRNNTQFSR